MVGATVYDVWRSLDGNVALDLTGEIKLPTADEALGLGSGEADYALKADVYRFLGGRSTLVGTLGYRLTASVTTGVFVDFRQSAISGAPAIREASVYLGRRFGDDWRAQGYLIRGLSETALDWGAGFSLRRGF